MNLFIKIKEIFLGRKMTKLELEQLEQLTILSVKLQAVEYNRLSLKYQRNEAVNKRNQEVHALEVLVDMLLEQKDQAMATIVGLHDEIKTLKAKPKYAEYRLQGVIQDLKKELLATMSEIKSAKKNADLLSNEVLINPHATCTCCYDDDQCPFCNAEANPRQQVKKSIRAIINERKHFQMEIEDLKNERVCLSTALKLEREKKPERL